MNLLIVNSLENGGAANACKRLHLGLLERDLNSKLLFKKKLQDFPQSFPYQPQGYSPSYIQKIKKINTRILKKLKGYIGPSGNQNLEIDILRHRPKELEMYSLPFSNIDLTNSPLYSEADIINLHWVANFLDYGSFFKKNGKPIVWTLHDMNPFIGIDHYREYYLGINEDGKPESRIITKEEKRINRKVEEFKRVCISRAENLTIVSPSNWLANEARKSIIFSGRPIHVIPNGLDSRIFVPKDKKHSRQILNLPEDKIVILFVADYVSNQRKGLEYLQKALQNINTKEVLLCAVGKSNNADLKNTVLLGDIKDERQMNIAYSAADIFIIPSLMDNFPNTILEALMCGTPVIGFPVGGIPEIVLNNFNGILAEEVSIDGLEAAIRKFLTNPNGFDNAAIRRQAVEKYDINNQANNYISLFKDIDTKNRKRNNLI